jgi:signal transduction histidine kinase
MSKTINNGVDYAVKILEDLKALTTNRELVKVKVDLADLVEQSLEGNVIPQSVRIKRAYTGSVNINADSTSIRRCIDNLVRNAVEAMPRGGDLTIAINVKDNFIELGVKDLGKGISA